MKIPRYAFAVLFGLALLLFTGYLLADTFLIKRVYAVAAAEPAAGVAAAEPAAELLVTALPALLIMTPLPVELSTAAFPAGVLISVLMLPGAIPITASSD